MKSKPKTPESLTTPLPEKAKALDQLPLAGIAALDPDWHHRQAGKRLFWMVMNEEGSLADLEALVSHKALLWMAIEAIDHRNAITSRINNTKSRASAGEKSAAWKKTLHEWLDRNISAYKGNLDGCANAACEHFPILEVKWSSVRREISRYGKMKTSSN